MSTRRFANQTGRAVFIVAALTDRAKLGTLRAERAANARLRRCLYWMRVAADEGTDPGAFLDRALAGYADAPAHGRLVRDALRRNYDIAAGLGCLSEENMARLRHGRAPVIERSRFRGQKAEVDHIVPISHAWNLRHDFANLRLTARSTNRRKSNRIGAKQIAHADRLAAAGLLTGFAVETLRAVADGRQVTVPEPSGAAVGAASAGNGTGAGGGGGFGQTDARVLLARVAVLNERLEDWEHRAQHAVEGGRYTGRQASELIDRAGLQARRLLTRAEEDAQLAVRLAEQVERAGERCRETAAHAQAAVREAQGARQAADAAVNHWTAELHAAQQWLAQALAHEQHARHVYNQAYRALSQAQNHLSHAQSELWSAQSRTEYAGTDRNGNAVYRPVDTSPYVAAVNAAQHEVAVRSQHLAAAEHDLNVAIAEREAAERRVHACESAVAFARQGQDHARLAAVSAAQADAAADRAREEHARAVFDDQEAHRLVREESDAVTAMQARLTAAGNHRATADGAFAEADTLHGDARNRAIQGRLEIDWRLDQLRAFDAPLHGI